MSRWTSEDDLALLIQANNERPFLQDRECEVDGKKTSHRFHLLLDNHEKFQKESVYLSGVDQEHNEMHILLDELVALRKDNMAKKKGSNKQTRLISKKRRGPNIRDEAMRTYPKKRAKVQNDERDEASTTPSKKKMLVDFHQAEIQLEWERLAFKKAKMRKRLKKSASIARKGARHGRTTATSAKRRATKCPRF
ncbi:hypothetical protein H257_01598 [Aphanomyces astaci]|uniref:Uncharacterized protein n=1 Tax=Aphanomyces astaci TaxID=112090 RepID=W4H8F7_APHAT|nr:hypothetical protein H257_01598 [Aphanomyces astaci]ETV88325.1 hypothetical protein H257_01598 [Aphanomyces astaci]|eukprot:XP_009823188.1 hypothetical protein H257_01598 [Aphanomyces astaci]